MKEGAGYGMEAGCLYGCCETLTTLLVSCWRRESGEQIKGADIYIMTDIAANVPSSS
jgi:hypothetical protein